MDTYSRPSFQPQLALREFFEAFDLIRRVEAIDPFEAELLRARCLRLLNEEYAEVVLALVPGGDIKEVAKELADLVYVAFYTSEAYGIDLEKVFRAVHGSNMSKLAPDGTYTKDPRGKVLKGDFYRPPALDDIMQDPTQTATF